MRSGGFARALPFFTDPLAMVLKGIGFREMSAVPSERPLRVDRALRRAMANRRAIRERPDSMTWSSSVPAPATPYVLFADSRYGCTLKYPRSALSLRIKREGKFNPES
jgi:hypothetical protein